MRVQCCICTDLLQGDSEVAAVVCGHVFHNVCLMQWIGTNSKGISSSQQNHKNFDLI